jgi:manganese transport protein
MFTSDRKKMGEFVSPVWVRVVAWLVTAVIIVLNLKLLSDTLGWTGK